MASFYFIVSDKDEQNPPHDNEELKRRMDEIKELIPQPLEPQRDNNMRFAARAFKLFKDCGLICRENMEHLNDKQWCDQHIDLHFDFLQIEGDKTCNQMNPLGGVVRREDLPMCDKSNLRYYCPRNELKLQSDIKVASNGFGGASKLAVVCEGVTYYISNDWFSQDKPRPTKLAFYKWLAVRSVLACEKIWKSQSEKISSTHLNELRGSHVAPDVELVHEITDELKPDDEPLPVTVDKPDDLSKVIESLKILHAKVDNLTLEFDELKKAWE